MTWYLPSKFLGMFVTLVLASIISFAAIELPQGSYLSSYRAQLQASDVSAEQIEGELRYIEERFALSQPVYTRYFTWISGLVRGDLGYSLALRQPVAELLGDRLANSLSLALATTIFTLIVGMGIGTIAAVFPYSIWDNTLTLWFSFSSRCPTSCWPSSSCMSPSPSSVWLRNSDCNRPNMSLRHGISRVSGISSPICGCP